MPARTNPEEYRRRLHRAIPGGAHTYSRGDDQYPENAPVILERGKGAYVWDPDGNKYLDYGMGLRSITLGYDFDAVSNAAIAEIRKGNNLTRASLTELEAAEAFLDLIPYADMVKFAKNGSTVTSAAVKLARAYTGKRFVARCTQHPFFSYDDWFIGDTIMKKGIPPENHSLTLRFDYNDITSLENQFNAHPGQIAAVILEPATAVTPENGFLQKIKDLCLKHGAVYILDEMITGFRFHLRGACTLFDVEPDLVTFGKGMANGFSVAALAGKREIMNLGGITDEGSERVFLISTTHGAEMSGLGAFKKTLEIYQNENVIAHIWDYGNKLIDGVNRIASSLGLKDVFSFEGFPCSPVFTARDATGQISMPFRTLFMQEMVQRGILIPWIALSYSHRDEELEMTLRAAEDSLLIYRKALGEGIEKYLSGKPVRPVFRAYN